MGFKEENYTPKGLRYSIFLWMMIVATQSFGQSAPHCPVRVDIEPQINSQSRVATDYRQNLFPFFTSWNDLNEIRTSDDQYASVSLSAYKRSTMLMGSQAGFNLPANTHIDGIELFVEGHSLGEGYAEGLTIQLTNQNGQPVGNNMALAALPEDHDWLVSSDTTDFIWRYGNESNTWGLDLNEFLIENSNFGYVIQVRNKLDKQVDVYIDNISIVVHYTPLYSICAGHACPPFYVFESEDPQITYEWYIPQGWELISDSEHDYAINIGPSYAEFGTYEICVESFLAGDSQGTCCRKFNYEDCNPGRIEGSVFEDLNGSFTSDSQDGAVSDIIINLFNTSGSLIESSTTDAQGNYFFEVVMGDYYVEVLVLDDNYTFVFPNIGSESVDSDIINEFGIGTTGILNVISEETISDVDAGISATLSIGDFVWEDANGDGIQQNDELGLEGTIVNLTNQSIGTLSTSSDADGFYAFDNLPSGEYSISFAPQGGFSSSPVNVSAPETDNDFDGTPILLSYLAGGSIDSIDAGFFNPGTIGDYVWENLNEDGIQNENEEGILNTKLVLLDANQVRIDSTLTDSSGFYQFTDLLPGEYTIQVFADISLTATLANQGADVGLDSDGIIVDGNIESSPIFLNSGETRNDIDFGFFIKPVAISGFTWLDENNDGQYQPNESFIGDVTVTLYNDNADSINSTTSDMNGFFSFPNEIAGNYYLTFEEPDNFFFTGGDIGDNNSDSDVIEPFGPGTTAVFSLLPGDLKFDLAAGYQENPKVGDFVWEDTNGNGTQDEGETGVNGIGVFLLDAGGTIIESTITSPSANGLSGYYLFDSIPPGDYYINLEIPEGYVITKHDTTDLTSNSDIDNGNGLLTTSTFTLAGNECNLDIDAGLFTLATIGDYIWEDANMNAIQDSSEVGIEEATVILLDSDGIALDSVITDESGLYSFDGINPGEYFIKVKADTFLTLTQAYAGTDDSIDSDGFIDDDMVISDPIILSSGEVNNNIDFGFFFLPVEIGGITWLDSNNDGQFTFDEPVLSNITVSLYQSNSTFVTTTTTDDNGFYIFTDIPAGDYYLEFDLEFGNIFTDANIGDDITDSDVDSSNGDGTTSVITLNPGEISITNAAGYQVLPKVGDYVWLDESRDGIQNTEEAGINDITVMLSKTNGEVLEITQTTTNPETGLDGYYLFDTIPVGEYYITFQSIDTLDYTILNTDDSTLNSDITGQNGIGTTNSFSLIGNQCKFDIDGGYILTRSDISGEVWVDQDLDGIQNVTDSLLSNVGVDLYFSGGTLLASTSTDENGQYQFTQLESGDYYVVFNIDNRYIPTLPLQGSDIELDSDIDDSQVVGSTSIFTVQDGINITNIDGGLIDGAIDIDGTTWIDNNADGLFIVEEEEGLGFIIVRLFDTSGVQLDTTITNLMGHYSFPNIEEGKYYLTFEALDETLINTDSNIGTDDTIDDDVTNAIVQNSTDTIMISYFNELSAINAGYFRYATIGDMVFIDVNENDINDSEPGLDDVIVNLIDSDGLIVNSTMTSQGGGLDSGYYQLTNVKPGDYTIQFERPLFYQYINGNQGTDDTNDSDVIDVADNIGTTSTFSVTSGSINNDIDAGLVFRLPMESSISGVVWDDLNSNGIRDMDEPIMSGILFELLDMNQSVLATDSSDDDGFYRFDMLIEGSYTIRAVLPSGQSATFVNVGGDDTIDNDFMPMLGNNLTESIFVNGLDSIFNTDLGISQTTSVGDLVWEDLNNNGLLESEETGIANVEIEITDIFGTFSRIGTTDVNGNYQFIDIPTGEYQICTSIPDGYYIGKKDQGTDQDDSDANDNGCTDYMFFGTGQNDDIDIAMTRIASIRGLAFTDLNGNGLQNNSDPGFNDLKVVLYDENGTFVDSTRTQTLQDTVGVYLFDSIKAGSYYIEFQFPSEYILSDPNLGTDDIDSDITNLFGLGTTDIIELESGANIIDLDGGAYLPGCIGDRVWMDTNMDGIQDEDETGVADIEVVIFRSFGIPIDTVFTNAQGIYKFSGLKQGLYFVRFIVPQNFKISPENIGINDNIDSDADNTGTTPLISLAHGADLTSVDCGISESNLASLRSVVWEDSNADGIRQIDEARIKNIRLTLYDDQNVAIASTLSNGLGMYGFQEIPEGDYKVFVDLSGTDYEFAPIDMAGDDLLDSDINPNGESNIFSSAQFLSVPNVDVGLFLTGNVVGLVWDDENANGYQELEERSLVGVTASLYNTDDEMIQQTITSNATENLLFDKVRPGDYYIKYTFAEEKLPSMITGVPEDDTNSDIIEIEDEYMSPVFKVESGRIVQHIDAGFYDKPTLITTSLSPEIVNDNNPHTESELTESLGVSVHPNPASNYLKINISNGDRASVKVVNSEQKVVIQTTAENIEKIDIRNLHPGIYYIMVENGTQSITKPFIKVH